MSQLFWLEVKNTWYKQPIVQRWRSWWCCCCWCWWWWWRSGIYWWCLLRKAGWRVGVQIDAGFQFDLLLPNQIICDIVALVIMVMIWWPLPKQCHWLGYFYPGCSWDAGLFQNRPHICHFFSTNVLLGSIFLHMKFCIYGSVFYITHMPYVENFRFLHICHVETSEISPHVEKFSISPQLPYMERWNFSTWQIFLH